MGVDELSNAKGKGLKQNLKTMSELTDELLDRV